MARAKLASALKNRQPPLAACRCRPYADIAHGAAPAAFATKNPTLNPLAPFTPFTPMRCLFLLIQFVLPVTLSPADEPRRPNVLYIVTDDQRWDYLGIAGHPFLETPHMDRLAVEGVWFKNAFCTTSLCSPSRASVLSGLYAHRHGVTNNFTDYPDDLPSFPRLLHESGYASAYIGKWHMGEDDDSPRPGFDWFVTHKGQGQYFDTEFNFNGERREVVEGYYTHVVTDMAMEWLSRERPDDQPWVLCLGHKAPHSFYYPEPKYEGVFDHIEIGYPDTAFQLEGKPHWIRQRLSTWHGIYGPLFDYREDFPDDSPEGVEAFANMVRAYASTIISVDDSIGVLLEFLEERGELDNTIIILLGDNGILEGEHGMVDKRTMHEPSIRVPLLMRYPGLVPAEGGPLEIEQQVLTVDIAPSILEMCGLPPLEEVHGRSWVDLVTTGDPHWRTSWFYYYDYEEQFPYTPNVRGIRTDEWKYIRYPHGDGSPDRHMPELYNIREDPEERVNLANDPRYAPKIAALYAELLVLMEATGLTEENDPMPIDQGIRQELPDPDIR